MMLELAAAPTSDAPWHAEQALTAMLGRCFRQLKPRAPLNPMQWAEKFRKLSAEENPDYAGDFRLDNTPALRGILAVCGARGIRRVVVQKSAQAGYTAGVVCSVLGFFTHWKPRVQVVMFPRAQSAKDFDTEKFSPMVRATAVLSKRIRLKSRADGNSATRKKYPGGLAKFVASNSPADVKSTSASVRIIEEPDDTNRDVKGQGNSTTLLRERGKTIRDAFELIGGTPTAKGASEIEREMRTTDQRHFMVPCHSCGESHPVDWDHVVIPGLNLTPEQLAAPDLDEKYPSREVYGRARHEDAFYACPQCGDIWTEEQRHSNIREAARVPPMYGWVPSADSPDPGFYCNELQSVFDGSRVPILAEKYLKALDQLDRGDATAMVAFVNSTQGRVWEYKGELPEEEDLEKRAEKYAEWSVPAAGGVEVMLSVDVQHDRLAATCWVVGQGEEMWLAYWGELYGQTIVAHQGAWLELEQLMLKTVRHPSGAAMPITTVGIDCSDGQTSDAGYAFVRKHHRYDREVLALKGAPDDEGRVEIWTPPKPIDPNNRSTKASRYGVQIHIVGTAKAKDLVLGWAQEGGRVRLEGKGPGRMHWYEGVRPDFYKQLLGEIKIPSRTNPKRRAWKARTDRRNEALDCTVYAVYLCRHRRLHARRPAHWELAEMLLRQPSLLEPDQPDQAPAADLPAALPTPSAPPVQTSAQAATTSTPPPAADPAPVPDAAAADIFKQLLKQRQLARKGVRYGR